MRRILMLAAVSLLFQSFKIDETVKIENEATVSEKPTEVISEPQMSSFEKFIEFTYSELEQNNTLKIPKKEVFTLAYKGYFNMLKQNLLKNKQLITIIDFSISANQKRMWIIDTETQNILFHELVSHGKNTGEEYATQFSNKHESFQSSLGFYVTGETYYGKNDYSLKMNGIEPGFNDNAYDRGIVMHGAEYVTQNYIKANKRLGRSQGCPALDPKKSKKIINTINGGSCMFLYYPEKKYLSKSKLLKNEQFSELDYAANHIPLQHNP